MCCVLIFTMEGLLNREASVIRNLWIFRFIHDSHLTHLVYFHAISVLSCGHTSNHELGHVLYLYCLLLRFHGAIGAPAVLKLRQEKPPRSGEICPLRLRGKLPGSHIHIVVSQRIGGVAGFGGGIPRPIKWETYEVAQWARLTHGGICPSGWYYYSISTDYIVVWGSSIVSNCKL